MPNEEALVNTRVQNIRLEKFDNDENGNPIRENGPVEIWEGKDESDMKCIYKRGDENAS